MSTVIGVLSVYVYPMGLSRMLYYLIESGKLKMASFKAEGQVCGQDMSDISKAIFLFVLLDLRGVGVIVI